MLVVNYLDYSFIEWENEPSLVLYTIGCNLRCIYCFNWKLATGELPEEMKTSLDKIVSKIINSKTKCLAITGGEPTIQPDIVQFIGFLTKHGFKVKIETNGTNPNILGQLLRFKDNVHIQLDIKAPFFGDYYYFVTGKDCLKEIRKSLKIVRKFPRYTLRCIVYKPVFNEDIVREMKREIPELEFAEYIETDCPFCPKGMKLEPLNVRDND